MEICFLLNGTPVRVQAHEEETLLEILRNRLGIRSCKEGCRPQGQCGSCLALVDGRPLTTCAIPATRVEGRNVVTLEGLDLAARDLYARCFEATSGLQCGWCIPGIVVRAHSFLQSNPKPTRSELARALDGHVCRCTGYKRILDALELAAAVRQGQPLPDVERSGGVGRSVARYQARALVLGERAFVADLTPPGLLHGALVLSRHPRARVLRIDPSKALALPGVSGVLTAADVPGERWVGLIIRDWPVFVAVGEEVRCVGDVLAAVAAEDPILARRAAALVEVEYEPLPPVLEPEASLEQGSPQVNPRHANLLSRSHYSRGQVEQALAESAHTVTGVWTTQRVDHLFMEPEACLAVPEEAGIRLFTQGQGIFDDRRQVAEVLGLKPEEVQVELVPNGGAFGGKEDLSVQAHAALLARHTGRPVRVALSREESVLMHPKRHPMRLEYSAGCDAEGRLTGVQARIVGDSGAYASVGDKVMERAAGHACGPYRVPALDIESLAVYTNNPPCGAMRGFGVNQAAFAIEGCLDLLARKVGLDAWEIRRRNLVGPGDLFTTGQVLGPPAAGAARTLEALREPYLEARRRGRAVGLACGIKNVGIGNGVEEWGKARLVVEADGTVSLFCGYTEMGQGLLTILTQFAAEASGLPSDLFHPRVDSTFALDCGQTTGSRATFFAGPAVLDAAGKLRRDLESGQTLADLVGRVYAADLRRLDTTSPDAPGPVKTHSAFSYAAQMVILDPEGRLEKVVAAHDVGRAINPSLCEAQIEGAIHMGLGYALSEELPCENGRPVSTRLRDLGVLRARDMPEIQVILIEEPEPEGPCGAKGVGEIGLVPTAAAVAGAVANFDGRTRFCLPMKDSPAFQALSVGRLAGDRSRWH